MKVEKKAYLSASIGNVLEFYDFALYGFYAKIISELFFPLDHPVNALLLTYGVFAVGFLARPLGAIIFGIIGDRFERKTSLSLSLIGIAFATTAMGLLPSYSNWGLLSPISLTILRIIQGICIGGEYSNSLVFVSEHLEKYRAKFPAFTTGIVSAMGVMGWFIASLMGTLFNGSNSLLSWRIPFILGSIVGVIGYYIRKHTEDAYEKSRNFTPFVKGVQEFMHFPKHCFEVMAIGILMGALFYGQFIFSYSFLPLITNLSSTQVSKLVSVGIFAYMIFLPISGWISDKLGHKKMILFSCILSFFLSPLFFYLSASGVQLNILFSQVLVAFTLAALMSPGTYYMSLVFPSHIRCAATSINYNLGATLFGGTAPTFGLILYQYFKDPLAPAIFLSIAALIAGLCLRSINLTCKAQKKPIFTKNSS
ncbi:MAG: MFS transporter [Simkania sp.]|nr:MFS transporter [Simkania sp.]